MSCTTTSMMIFLFGFGLVACVESPSSIMANEDGTGKDAGHEGKAGLRQEAAEEAIRGLGIPPELFVSMQEQEFSRLHPRQYLFQEEYVPKYEKLPQFPIRVNEQRILDELGGKSIRGANVVQSSPWFGVGATLYGLHTGELKLKWSSPLTRRDIVIPPATQNAEEILVEARIAPAKEVGVRQAGVIVVCAAQVEYEVQGSDGSWTLEVKEGFRVFSYVIAERHRSRPVRQQ